MYMTYFYFKTEQYVMLFIQLSESAVGANAQSNAAEEADVCSASNNALLMMAKCDPPQAPSSLLST